jgi:hypothetical protein
MRTRNDATSYRESIMLCHAGLIPIFYARSFHGDPGWSRDGAGGGGDGGDGSPFVLLMIGLIAILLSVGVLRRCSHQNAMPWIVGECALVASYNPVGSFLAIDH